jgi:hypothetical protein
VEKRKKNTTAAAGGSGCGCGAAYPLPSLNGACCRRGGKFLFCRWGGKFPSLLKSCSLGWWRWFADCWTLLLPRASLLPMWSPLLLCCWSSLSLPVGGGLSSVRFVIWSLIFPTGSELAYPAM